MQVTVDNKASYLHYLGKHPMYGDAIRVLPREQLPDRSSLTSVGYVVFYPVMAAVRHGLVDIVGHHDVGVEIPRKMRRAGARANDGRVLSWIIEEDGKDMLTRELTPEERALSIAVIWNHEMLCTRIREGWRPENEG